MASVGVARCEAEFVKGWHGSTLHSRIDAIVDAEMTAARVRALSDRALLDSWYGSLTSPDVEVIEAALEAARGIDDRALLIRALMARGCVVLYDDDSAEPYFTEAADLARELGDALRLTHILGRQAYRALFVAGDVHGAISSAREGSDLAHSQSATA